MTEQNKLPELADKVLQDQILLQKLSYKVYQLMLEDLRMQRNRFGLGGNYRG